MKYFFIIFTAVLLASCGEPIKLSEKEQEDIINDVTIMMKNYCKDVKQSGLTAEFRYLDNSSDFFWVPPGYKSSISYDSVAAILKRNASIYKSVDNSYQNLRIIPLSKELASYTAKVNSVMTDTTGKTSAFTLIETGIVIKRKDGWKLLNGQTTVID